MILDNQPPTNKTYSNRKPRTDQMNYLDLARYWFLRLKQATRRSQPARISLRKLCSLKTPCTERYVAEPTAFPPIPLLLFLTSELVTIECAPWRTRFE